MKTNKDRYKQAFSALRAPDDLPQRVEKEIAAMKYTTKRRGFKPLVAAAAACLLLAASATAAYAADVGGIQRTLQIWIQGEQTDATIQFDGNGSYAMDYTDQNGNTRHQGGGGVALGPDGTEIPLTEEELMEELTAPDVEYKEDGTVWVYWFDQAVEITDKFENGICHVKLERPGETQYMTVYYQDGYTSSPYKYISH